MNENNSPLERLLDWCAGQVETTRMLHERQNCEIDDDLRQEIEQVEADMRAVERDHRSLVDAYGAAIQELQRLGAKSVPLTPSTAWLRDLLGGYECPKCGGSGRIPVIDLGVGEVIDKVPCPVCRPDDTPRRDALEALKEARRYLRRALGWVPRTRDVTNFRGKVEDYLERTESLVEQNSAENKHSYAVPEAVRRLPGEWRRQHGIVGAGYATQLEAALAQHSEERYAEERAALMCLRFIGYKIGAEGYDEPDATLDSLKKAIISKAQHSEPENEDAGNT